MVFWHVLCLRLFPILNPLKEPLILCILAQGPGSTSVPKFILTFNRRTFNRTLTTFDEPSTTVYIQAHTVRLLRLRPKRSEWISKCLREKADSETDRRWDEVLAA